jgi:hypothetical protein
MRMIQYPFVWVMGMMLVGMETICEVWQRINEYERQKSRGFTLMKSDDGDDFWVGYGD